MNALHNTPVKLQLTNIERRTKIMSFKKLPKASGDHMVQTGG